MKINILGFLFLISFSAFSQLNLQSNTTDFYVGFKLVEYSNLNDSQILELNNALKEYDFHIENAIKISNEKLNQLSKQAIKNVGNDNSIQFLKNIVLIQLKANLNESQIAEVNRKISSLNFVTYCENKTTRLVNPPTDIPPTTPSLVASQNYLYANPGVNVEYAWNNNYIGSGINLHDIEYGMNINHEEFNSINVSIASGMSIYSGLSTAYTEHGTAAVGIVFADSEGYGVTGMAYGANSATLYPEYSNEFGFNRPQAITEAINNANLGDILMFEMQAYGAVNQSNDFVPAEYELTVWNLTKAATDAGLVVVAAAGNGNQNLDNSNYTSYMNRGDSGAIIVGAGTSNTTHQRISYSTYGSRVNLQGWGQNVLAPGYGDYVTYGSDFNQQYTNFSGTSSATPIVASCAIILQSLYFNATGNYLTSQQIRDILIQTGIPQGGDISKHIGPLPNMQAAITLLNTNLAAENFNNIQVNVYPNPAENLITIENYADVASLKSLKIVNTLGQTVKQIEPKTNTTQIDISNLSSGIYIIQFEGIYKNNYQKFIKK